MVTFSYGFPLLSPPYEPERTDGASITVLARAAERAGFAACDGDHGKHQDDEHQAGLRHVPSVPPFGEYRRSSLYARPMP
ncbi:MAG: hypothetical protein ACERLM_17350, partial [Acidimicrobiales bacterium]